VIDLHAHILPGFDDGADSLAESLEMARAYVQAGYTQVVATPHVIPGLYEHTRREILVGVKGLQAAIQSEGIELAVLPAAEYYLTTELPEAWARGELLTVNDNGRYLLVELPVQELPLFTDQVLFDLLLAGVTPVLVHPERNQSLATHPEMLAAMVHKGIVAQITAGCLTGLFGHACRSTAQLFVNRGWAQIVATDAHSAGRRLAAGLEAARLLGRQSRRLMYENPWAVINDRPLTAAPEASAGSNRGGGIFTRIKRSVMAKEDN
jgi:protein-tyrosine phosphatase